MAFYLLLDFVIAASFFILQTDKFETSQWAQIAHNIARAVPPEFLSDTTREQEQGPSIKEQRSWPRKGAHRYPSVTEKPSYPWLRLGHIL